LLDLFERVVDVFHVKHLHDLMAITKVQHLGRGRHAGQQRDRQAFLTDNHWETSPPRPSGQHSAEKTQAKSLF